MDNPELLGYIALFAPFVAVVLITLLTLKSKSLSAGLAVLGMVVSLAATAMLGMDVLLTDTAYSFAPNVDWLSIGEFSIPFGVQIDALSVLMSGVVTVVGTCIFVYSTGYMKGEEGYSRYFACLSLFAFSMQGIVFSTNLVQTFIFWELVGVSSYALIGYYFAKPSAVDAGKKAFLTNRIGDFGMTCGILLLFFTLKDALGWEGITETVNGVATTYKPSFDYASLAEIWRAPAGSEVAVAMSQHAMPLAWAAFLIFTGALAKSAQVPLHVWLPDAMEGPTPVSALMHAATMVAAGVYLGCRVFFMLEPYDDVLHVIAWIGGVTAFLAATMAFVQNDIKKVLAYSTLSQLGYMTMAIGLKAPSVAMFHLTTHACFKALLFLGSGSVIHGCHHEQDMRKMGGLMKKMPVTGITFWIGTLALAGIFPFAGFWSKDAILSAASLHSIPLLIVGIAVALMTAAYMGRCCLLTFHGEYRGDAHPHESPKSMTLPLVVLAALSVVAGAISLPLGFPGVEHAGWLEHTLMQSDGIRHGVTWFRGVVPEEFHPDVAASGSVAALVGLLIGWLFFGKKRTLSVEKFANALGPVHTLVARHYFFDDAYLWLVQSVQQRFARFCDFIEVHVLRRIIDTIAAIHHWFGRLLGLLLDGHLHRYVTVALLGLVLILSYVLVGG